MSSIVLEVKLKITVRDQDIDDIMSCALDGGICYWCKAANVVGEYLGEYASDQISRGGQLELVPYEGDPSVVIDQDAVLRGIRMALENDYLRNDMLDTEDGKLVLDIDGAAADAIIQYGAFGELVYG